jgi:division protein CdvB (Snf7/Vps24/ESCRT-III family)
MGQTVKGMTNAMKAMDPVKISATMEEFEQCFEDMDVASGTMEAAMESTTGNLTPPEEVDNLIQMVADQAGLTLSGQMDSAGPVGTQDIATQETGETSRRVIHLLLLLLLLSPLLCSCTLLCCFLQTHRLTFLSSPFFIISFQKR